MVGVGNNPSISFKFNPSWLDEKDFVNMVKENWMPFDHNRRE
jgi:hypothetical protein